MKKFGISLACLLFAVGIFAQESEFTKMMRQMYQDEFIDIVNENMNLSKEQNEVFQPIFNDFISELGEIMDSKLMNQGKFAKYFDSMSDEQVKEIMNNAWSNSKSYDKLMKKYTGKISKTINSQSAFRFFLIVEKISGNIEFSMIQNLPLVKN